jgi:opacity protein-like surface antigen
MNHKIYTLMTSAALVMNQAHAKTEVFLGAQGGYDLVNAKLRRYTQFNNAAFNVSDKGDISGGSALGGAFAELRRTFDNTVFVSAQINGYLSGFKKTNTAVVNSIFNFMSTSLKLKNSIGGALRLGACFKGTLPYAKLGFASSQWKSKTQIDPGFEGTGSKRRAGIELGAGIDIPLACKFLIGAEFSHLIYRKLSYRAFNGAGQNRLIVIKPRENRVLLSVKYKLN